MTLREIVEYQIKSRKAKPGTPIESFTNPPLLWCELIHIYDERENLVTVIDGRELTSELLEKYGEYEEFKPEFCGYDYTHHNYLKPKIGGIINGREEA